MKKNTFRKLAGAVVILAAVFIIHTPSPVFASTRTFLVDFGNTDKQTTATGWNNIVNPSTGTTAALKDSTGAATALSLQITDAFILGSTPTYSANINGTTTSGIYPATATNDSFFVSPTYGSMDSTAAVKISGLNQSATYTFKFYGSRMASDTTNRTAVYKIGTATAELNATNNTANTVSIANVVPTSGAVTISITTKSGVSNYAYLGVLEVTETDNSGVNLAPTANAGTDKTVTLPTSSVTLNGSGTDTDGTIASYAWSQISGASATIASPTAATTAITGLVEGTYTFRLTVTDNGGATATDDVLVTVNPAANIAPSANAGVDQSITLPTDTVTLSGSGTDSDGTIASYAWTEVSGPAATIATPATASTVVSNMVQGSYTFRLTVTDNQGAIGTDTVLVTVNTATPINQPPTANAGTDIAITLPTSSVTLNGSGTDSDGTIASYAWTKLSGEGVISSPAAATSTVTGFSVAGTATFRLTVTDNLGATAIDDVVVTINPFIPANQAPTANAGADQNITLPINSVTLTGSGTDTDGTIASYAWTKVSGSGTITTPSAASTTVTGLLSGTSTFRLTVTDNLGATATDDIQVVVVDNSLQTLTTISGKNAYVHLPDDYATTGTKTYPLILFVPEYTSATSGVAADLLNYGPSHFIAQGDPMQFMVNGVLEKPIVISVQVGSWPQPTTFAPILTSILNQYRVDMNRVYLTGPSMGAWTTDMFVASNTTNAAKIAAIVAMHAVTIDLPESQMANFATTGGKWWGIRGAEDSWGSPNIPTIMNAAVPGSAIMTVIPKGQTGSTHCCWNTFYDPVWTSNNESIYTWMLKQTHAISGNQPPTANAGIDQTITSPQQSVTLSGSGTDTDGTIASYAWSFVSGPVTPTITAASAASTSVTGLTIAGAYTFRLTATDDGGKVAYDNVVITVLAQTSSCPAQTVAVIGSSTAYGTGATPISNSWVNKYTAFLQTLNAGNKVVNLGIPSVTSYNGLPTGTSIPAGRPSPDPAYNWNKAMTSHPGAVIINYPSNDTALGIPLSEQQANFETYAAAAAQDNVQLWVTTTQPRDTLSPAERQMQYDMKNWIQNRFGSHALDFWSTVSNADYTINSTYAYGDGVHVNNLGHDLFYQRVVNADIMSVLCGSGSGGGTVNALPTANAGIDKAITLPTSSTSFTGSGTDSDGTIASYAWTNTVKPAGATTPTISSPSSASTNITGLSTAGTYTFRLTVTDNAGATATDDVNVTVAAVAPTSGPYGGVARAIPGTIQAEDFDLGGQNVAYNDTATANQGGAYRTSEGVDIETTTDSGSGSYSVDYVAAGEWQKFTVTVAADGIYTFAARVGSPYAGKSLRMEIDGTVMATLSIPNTGKYQTYQLASVPNITLTAGTHTMRIYDVTDGFNVNFYTFTKTS